MLTISVAAPSVRLCCSTISTSLLQHHQYVSVAAPSVRLCCSTISTSLSIPSSFFTLILRLLSLRVTPRIRHRTDISKTWSFRLWSSLSVQVSALYSRIDWTRVWYSLTLVSLLMSGDFKILSRFLTIAAASSTLLAMSLSLVASQDSVPPK